MSCRVYHIEYVHLFDPVTVPVTFGGTISLQAVHYGSEQNLESEMATSEASRDV